MLVIFIRAIILYFLVLIVMRLMGKSEISQFQPFELVIAIMIADLATVPMQNPDMSLINGVVSIVALLIAHIIISSLSIKNKYFNKLTSGSPEILINRGKIDIKELEKQQMTIKELKERLRQDDCPYIEDVYYAILETSGEISVILKKEKPNIKNDNGERGIQTSIVINGEIDENSLIFIKKDVEWVMNNINQMNKKLEDIILMCVDELDNIVVFTRDEVYE